METLKQKALDYTLGVLPKEESLLFEAQLEEDDDARKFLVEAQEDCASLSMTAAPASLSNEVRSRVMEYCEPKMDFDPFLSSNDISRLRDNFSSAENRYQGGDASVDINDINEGSIKDEVLTSYDHLINLLPLISGNSKAAAGEFDDLQSVLRSKPSLSDGVDQILEHDLKAKTRLPVPSSEPLSPPSHHFLSSPTVYVKTRPIWLIPGGCFIFAVIN